MVGWGQAGYLSEIDARRAGAVQRPPAAELGVLPDVRAARGAGGPTTAAGGGRVALTRARTAATVYASWNGATEVASWRVLAGSLRDALAPVASAAKDGFETAIPLPAASPAPTWRSRRSTPPARCSASSRPVQGRQARTPERRAVGRPPGGGPPSFVFGAAFASGGGLTAACRAVEK